MHICIAGDVKATKRITKLAKSLMKVWGQLNAAWSLAFRSSYRMLLDISFTFAHKCFAPLVCGNCHLSANHFKELFPVAMHCNS